MQSHLDHLFVWGIFTNGGGCALTGALANTEIWRQRSTVIGLGFLSTRYTDNMCVLVDLRWGENYVLREGSTGLGGLLSEI
ncbi:hypothetical protein BJX63DRAFT_376611 [Aspergillus granulosus]|uniref:Uncharacterized protein n=1 Tax=Aspergillus granulosus TaxID=176169 RepID=A0ABR4I3Z7_9EURO